MRIIVNRKLTGFSDMSAEIERKKNEASMKDIYSGLGFGVVLYYLLPFLAMIAGIGVVVPFMILMVNTLYVFIASYIHGIKHNFNAIVPILFSCFFIPSVIVFRYDISFALATVIYLVLGYFGELTAYLFIRRKNSGKLPFGLNWLVKDGKNNKQSGNNKGNKNGKNKR